MYIYICIYIYIYIYIYLHAHILEYCSDQRRCGSRRLELLELDLSIILLQVCRVYTVQCTMYTDYYTLYTVYRTQCTLYTVHCIQCILYTVHCIQCILYTVHCTLLLRCTECTKYVLTECIARTKSYSASDLHNSNGGASYPR